MANKGKITNIKFKSESFNQRKFSVIFNVLSLPFITLEVYRIKYLTKSRTKNVLESTISIKFILCHWVRQFQQSNGARPSPHPSRFTKQFSFFLLPFFIVFFGVLLHLISKCSIGFYLSFLLGCSFVWLLPHEIQWKARKATSCLGISFQFGCDRRYIKICVFFFLHFHSNRSKKYLINDWQRFSLAFFPSSSRFMLCVFVVAIFFRRFAQINWKFQKKRDNIDIESALSHKHRIRYCGGCCFSSCSLVYHPFCILTNDL